MKSDSKSSIGKPSEEEEEGSEVPTQHKSAFISFLKQLGSFTGDLSALTAPAFLLNGISLLEYSTHWCDFPQILDDCHKFDDPAVRMLNVTKWFVSTLYGSYHERCKDGSEKKPYNPILGEQFFCRWNSPVSPSCIIEQVSHHPPVTAFHVQTTNTFLTGHCGQKSKFKGMAIRVQQTGRVKLVIPRKNETIEISLPELVIRGLFSGKIFLELDGPVHLVSSLGYTCHLDFLPKPWFSGDYHCLKGTIFKEESNPIYKLSGRWVDTVTAKQCTSGEEVELWKVDYISKRPEMIVKSIAEMGELESRKVWLKVTEALEKEEYGIASKEKNDIEDYQRQLRKEREEKGDSWSPMFFEFIKDDEVEKGEKSGANLLKKSGSLQHIKTLDIGSWHFKSSAAALSSSSSSK